MFWSLLADEPTQNPWMMYIVLGVVVVIFVVWMVFSGRKNKQRQKEYTEQLEAIRPGHKVKTAGGICGIVVEVCDDNTIIMETGSETAKKSGEVSAPVPAREDAEEKSEPAEAKSEPAEEKEEK